MESKTQAQKPLELVCPICIDMFIRPVVTICGHTFCYRCLDEAILFNSVCPVCRTYIRGSDIIVCKAFNEVVIRYFNINFRFLQKFTDPGYKDSYQAKLKDFQKWINERSLNPQLLFINKYIDARDTQFIWCKAAITNIYKKQDKIQSIMVHYLGWNSIYDQILDIKSQRLSNYRFYSSRMDIPHYHISNQYQENMYSYVVIGQPYLPNQQRVSEMSENDIPENLIHDIDIISDLSVEQNPPQIQQEMQPQRINNLNNVRIDYIMLESEDNQSQSSIQQNPQVEVEQNKSQLHNVQFFINEINGYKNEIDQLFNQIDRIEYIKQIDRSLEDNQFLQTGENGETSKQISFKKEQEQ